MFHVKDDEMIALCVKGSAELLRGLLTQRMVRWGPALVAPYRPLPFYKPLGPGLCPAAAVHHQHLLHGWNLESEWESKAANEER